MFIQSQGQYRRDILILIISGVFIGCYDGYNTNESLCRNDDDDLDIDVVTSGDYGRFST